MRISRRAHCLAMAFPGGGSGVPHVTCVEHRGALCSHFPNLNLITLEVALIVTFVSVHIVMASWSKNVAANSFFVFELEALKLFDLGTGAQGLCDMLELK